MSVDTAALRSDCCDHPNCRVCPLRKSAADELDELRAAEREWNREHCEACDKDTRELERLSSELIALRARLQSAEAALRLFGELPVITAHFARYPETTSTPSTEPTGWLLLGAVLALEQIHRGVQQLQDNDAAASAYAYRIAENAFELCNRDHAFVSLSRAAYPDITLRSGMVINVELPSNLKLSDLGRLVSYLVTMCDDWHPDDGFPHFEFMRCSPAREMEER